MSVLSPPRLVLLRRQWGCFWVSWAVLPSSTSYFAVTDKAKSPRWIRAKASIRSSFSHLPCVTWRPLPSCMLVSTSWTVKRGKFKNTKSVCLKSVEYLTFCGLSVQFPLRCARSSQHDQRLQLPDAAWGRHHLHRPALSRLPGPPPEAQSVDGHLHHHPGAGHCGSRRPLQRARWLAQNEQRHHRWRCFSCRASSAGIKNLQSSWFQASAFLQETFWSSWLRS